MVRFDVSTVQVGTAGSSEFVVDAHITTRTRKISDLITVAVGNALVYAYDLAAVRGFATACRTALGFMPAEMPAELPPTTAGPVRDRNGASVVLRVEGAPGKAKINGLGAAYGPPRVRIELDRLVIDYYDQAALRAWADGWADVEKLALRLWPDPDVFDQAEARERKRIARAGSPTTKQAPR